MRAQQDLNHEWNDIRNQIQEKRVESVKKLSDSSGRGWEDAGGKELEPALRTGAIALMDAFWLVDFARGHCSVKTKNVDNNSTTTNNNQLLGTSSPLNILPCRQDLPPEAFVSLEEIICASNHRYGIPIIALSYMWLHPDHPDPKGETLQLVAKGLQKTFREVLQYHLYDYSIPCWGIFWDFGSLYQHGCQSVTYHHRTQHQKALFQQGLNFLSVIYSHPQIFRYKVTEFPPGYSHRGYGIDPAKHNHAKYMDRGWPFVESCWSSAGNTYRTLHLNYVENVELCQEQKTGLAPLSPEKFWSKLKGKSFTNAKDDLPLVMHLYETAFERRFQTLKSIRYWMDMAWQEEEFFQICDILARGYTPCLELLELSCQSTLGRGVCRALSQAICPGKCISPLLPALHRLDLSLNCALDDECVKEMATLLVQMKEVNLSGTGIGPGACQALRQTFQNGQGCCIKLCVLMLSKTKIGDRGIEELASLMVGGGSQLQKVDVSACDIGNEGCQTLVNTADPLLCCLQELFLHDNNNIDATALGYLCQLVETCPSIQKLVLPKKLRKKGETEFEASASNEDFHVWFW